MAIYRAHRGPRQYAFRAHVPLRKHSTFKAHQRRALRPKRRTLIQPGKVTAARAAKYKSMTWKVPSSYRRLQRPAPYRPVRPAGRAYSKKRKRMYAGGRF